MLPPPVTFRLAVTEMLIKEDRQDVRMSAVHSNDPSDPNRSFSKHAGTASFYFTVSNPALFGMFVPGVAYDFAAIATGTGFTLGVESVGAPAPAVPAAPAAPIAPEAPASEAPASDEAAGADQSAASDQSPPAEGAAPTDPALTAGSATTADQAEGASTKA